METGPEAMRRYRTLRNGMTQEALARLVGVSLATVQSAEQGKYVPRFATAKAYDDALEAGGEVLTAFGYAAVGQSSIDELVSRLAAIEQVARDGVPVLDLLHTEIQGLRQRVVALEATVRTLKRRRPQASGE